MNPTLQDLAVIPSGCGPPFLETELEDTPKALVFADSRQPKILRFTVVPCRNHIKTDIFHGLVSVKLNLGRATGKKSCEGGPS